MVQKLLFVCALLLLTSLGFVRAEVDDKEVIVLTADNFDDIVNSHPLILVEFYAPWCGHCKALQPEYAEAAKILLENDPAIPLAKLDATAHGAIAGRFGVSGYPTLKVFRDGSPNDYNGPRKAAGIVSYMKRQVGPSAKPLETVDDVNAFAKSDMDAGFAVVGFFNSGKPSQLQSSFTVISNRLRDQFSFGKVTKPDVAAQFGISGEGLIVFKSYDEGKVVYTGESKSAAVESWIMLHSLPVVGEITEKNADRYAKRDLPVAKAFVNFDPKSASNKKQVTYYMNRLRKVATEFAGKLVVAFAQISSFEREAGDYALKGKPFGFVIEKGWQDKYKFEGKFSADALVGFAQDFFDGKLDKYVRSEDEPADNSGPVKIATGRNFDNIVAKDKDVLVEFYAPWCGHCKALAPTYDKLGEKFKNVDSVVIAKIDATANDYPKEYQVQGYPSIFFKPKGGKPVKYEGGRDLDDFVSYIKKKAKTPFSLGTKKSKKSKKNDEL